MGQYRTLNITVKGKEEIGRLLLILNVGLMTAMEEEVITVEGSQFRFYSPFTVKQLRKRNVDEKIINLHQKALELEDIKNLVSKEHYFEVIQDLKLTSLEMLRKLPIQKELGYQHWIQQDRRHNDILIGVDREQRQVSINGYKIGGCIVDSCCPECGHKQIYYDKYDEDFCPRCNQWAKSVCGDENCPLCRERPQRPLK